MQNTTFGMVRRRKGKGRVVKGGRKGAVKVGKDGAGMGGS